MALAPIAHTHLCSCRQVILSVAEHHSNLVPWQLVAERTGAILKHVGLTPQQEIDVEVRAAPRRLRCCIGCMRLHARLLGSGSCRQLQVHAPDARLASGPPLTHRPAAFPNSHAPRSNSSPL